MNGKKVIKSSADKKYKFKRLELAKSLRNSPIPNTELTANIGLYTERMHLSRILLMHDLYKRIINVPGVILEFGVRWGQNMALFQAFRGMYEPYNYSRRVIGFDTFSGFPEVMKEDNLSTGAEVKEGDYTVQQNWQEALKKILKCHDLLSPLAHIQKWELVVGDATSTFPRYLDSHPELIVAFAYFDFDIYKPTKICLDLLRDRMPKGGIIAFDELNCSEFPGETIAVQEILGIKNIKLERDANNPFVSWCEVR